MAKISVWAAWVLSAAFFTNFLTLNMDLDTTIMTGIFVVGFAILGTVFYLRDQKKVKKTAVQ